MITKRVTKHDWGIWTLSLLYLVYSGLGALSLQIHSVGRTLRSSPRTIFACSPPVSKLIFVFPDVLAAPSVAGQLGQQCWERSGQSCGIKTRQATHFWDPEAVIGELGDDASSPSSACIAFWDRKASAKPVLILAVTISSFLYLGILPFCTWFRGLV